MLTRKLCKSMGLTDEQTDSLIEAHTDTVDGLKAEISKYKTESEKYREDAERLETVQKELNDIKKGTDWKTMYDNVKKDFDDYKAGIENEQRSTKVKAAYRKLLEDQKIDSADADLIMNATKFDEMKLDDKGGLADAENLTNQIKTNYARYIPTVSEKGANVSNPPKGDGNNGANSRAAELAKRFFEQKYGTTQKTNEVN